MSRKLILLLCSLLLAALPALAQDTPDYFNKGSFAEPATTFSADVQRMYDANAALFERYGLTAHCLGLFRTEVACYGDASIVRYIPRGRPHPALTGEYAVLITPEGTQAFWTHDNVDPTVWQSGELNSIAWGVPQLTAYLQADSFDREFFDAPYAPDPTEEWLTVEEHNRSTRVYSLRSGTLSPEDIQPADHAARAALKRMYNLSEEASAEIHLIDATRLMHSDGSSEWLLNFYHNTEPDEINYGVTIGSDLQTIIEISCSTGGIG